MPNKQITDGNYRYAFQGQEKDPETGMEAFELRLWDGRLGRWLSVDPMGEFDSPYLGMGNNPICLIDPDGGETDPPVKGIPEITITRTVNRSSGFNAGRAALDFVPLAGSGMDIYEGFRDGDGLKASLGVVFLVVDVATLGSGSIVKGGIKTIGKEVAEEVAEEAVEQGAKKFIYSARELTRRVHNPQTGKRIYNDGAHNFPDSFDDLILSKGTVTTESNYFKTAMKHRTNHRKTYKLDGEILDKKRGGMIKGHYEIGTRPSTSGRTEVIIHRQFRANKK